MQPCSFTIFSDNPRQRSRVPVLIKVLDVNDNAPEFAMFYETFVCENVRAGQVSKLQSIKHNIIIDKKFILFNEYEICINIETAQSLATSS